MKGTEQAKIVAVKSLEEGIFVKPVIDIGKQDGAQKDTCFGGQHGSIAMQRDDVYG